MKHRSTLFLCLVCLLLTVRFAIADPAYTTFVNRDADAIQKENIALKVDKKDTPVTDFLFVDTAKRSPEILYHPAGRRHYVLLFDLVFSKPEELLQARKDASLFLEKVDKEDLVAVAGISRKGLRFYCTFTLDRNKMITGLNSIGKNPAPQLLEGPEGYFYPTQFSPDSGEVQLIPDQEFTEQAKTFSVPETKKDDPRPGFVQGLVDLAFYFSSIPGRKNILLFSPGFDTEGIKRSAEIEVPEMIMQDTDDEQQYDLQKENSATIKNQSFDVELIPDLVAGSDSHVHIVSGAENDFFKSLSEKTKGVYSAKQSNFMSDLDQIFLTDSKYYVTGWDGKTEKEYKGLQSIHIDAAGKTVANQSRISPKPSSNYSPIEKKLNVSEAIYVDHPLLPGYHIWTDFLLENKVAKIPIFLQIAGNDILKQDLPDLALEFYGFAIRDRSVIDSALIPVRLDLKNKNLKGRLPSSGLKAWNVLLAEEGTVTVRLVIANWKTGEISTATSHLDINGSNLTVTNVFFPSLNLDWIIWPTPGDAQSRRGISVKYPYSVGYDLFFPDLTPQLSKTEKGRFFYFKIYNKSAAEKNPPIHIRFTDGQNQPVEISDFQLGQKPNALGQEGLELFWKIQSLPDVAPGPYQFQVDIMDPLNGQHLRRETGVQVK